MHLSSMNKRGPLLAVLACTFALLTPLTAQAGGFYLTDRGTLPLSRAGAFVAGARGLDSLWYNPAGLAKGGRQIHGDLTLTFFDASFQRVDDVGKTRPTVELDSKLIPVPLVGYQDNFGLEDWDFGVGILAPNAQAYRWPSDVDGKPAPQRYSLIATDKSLIVHLALGVAYSGIKGLSIGGTVHVVTGRFYTETVFSACDGFVCPAGTPEDPEFDTPSTVDLNPFVALTGGLGGSYDFGFAKLGASFLVPYSIEGDAKIEVGLPDHPAFDQARLEGDRVHMKVPFPAIVRAGVEIHPFDPLRVELAGVYEGWSRQDQIVVKPKDVWMRNVLGIGDYEVGTIRLQRDMKDVWSLRLGGEYTFAQHGLAARAGVAYENGAFGDRSLSPLTLDSDKVTAGLGGGIAVFEGVTLDLTFGHVFIRNRNVKNSEITQPVAIRPEPGKPSHIANGRYLMEANFIGAGLTWRPGSQ